MALSAVAVLALLVSIPYGAQAAPLSQVAPSVASTVLLSGTYSNFILDPFRDRVYVADSGNGRIIVWNTTTDRLIANVTVGGTPLGMDVSADGSQLYVALTSILSLGIVDLTTLKSVGSFRLTATPIDVAAGRMGRAYVTTNEYWGYPRILDTANRKEIGNITAGGQVYGASGGALARITRDRSTLYVGTRGLSPEDLYKFSVTSDSVSLLSHAPFNLIGANLGDADVWRPVGLRLLRSGIVGGGLEHRRDAEHGTLSELREPRPAGLDCVHGPVVRGGVRLQHDDGHEHRILRLFTIG
jgi:YVTN family beta-propeller protein